MGALLHRCSGLRGPGVVGPGVGVTLQGFHPVLDPGAELAATGDEALERDPGSGADEAEAEAEGGDGQQEGQGVGEEFSQRDGREVQDGCDQAAACNQGGQGPGDVVELGGDGAAGHDALHW